LDSQLLTKFLKTTGLKNIRQVNFGEGTDLRLLKENPDRRWETLYLEAQKE